MKEKPRRKAVFLKGNAFVPSQIQIERGEEIEFCNDNLTGSAIHCRGSLSIPSFHLERGKNQSIKFDNQGRFQFCLAADTGVLCVVDVNDRTPLVIRPKLFNLGLQKETSPSNGVSETKDENYDEQKSKSHPSRSKFHVKFTSSKNGSTKENKFQTAELLDAGTEQEYFLRQRKLYRSFKASKTHGLSDLLNSQTTHSENIVEDAVTEVPVCDVTDFPSEVYELRIESYEFSQSTLSVYENDSIVFTLSEQAKAHEEYSLKGTSDVKELCFSSDLLQISTCRKYEFKVTRPGMIHVQCEVIPEVQCSIEVQANNGRRLRTLSVDTSHLSIIAIIPNTSSNNNSPSHDCSGMSSFSQDDNDCHDDCDGDDNSFYDSDDVFSDEDDHYHHQYHSLEQQNIVSNQASHEKVPSNEDFTVYINEFQFRPDILHCHLGDTVKFVVDSNHWFCNIACDGLFQNIVLDSQHPVFMKRFDSIGRYEVYNEIFSFICCHIEVIGDEVQMSLVQPSSSAMTSRVVLPIAQSDLILDLDMIDPFASSLPTKDTIINTITSKTSSSQLSNTVQALPIPECNKLEDLWTSSSIIPPPPPIIPSHLSPTTINNNNPSPPAAASSLKLFGSFLPNTIQQLNTNGFSPPKPMVAFSMTGVTTATNNNGMNLIPIHVDELIEVEDSDVEQEEGENDCEQEEEEEDDDEKNGKAKGSNKSTRAAKKRKQYKKKSRQKKRQQQKEQQKQQRVDSEDAPSKPAMMEPTVSRSKWSVDIDDMVQEGIQQLQSDKGEEDVPSNEILLSSESTTPLMSEGIDKQNLMRDKAILANADDDVEFDSKSHSEHDGDESEHDRAIEDDESDDGSYDPTDDFAPFSEFDSSDDDESDDEENVVVPNDSLFQVSSLEIYESNTSVIAVEDNRIIDEEVDEEEESIASVATHELEEVPIPINTTPDHKRMTLLNALGVKTPISNPEVSFTSSVPVSYDENHDSSFASDDLSVASLHDAQAYDEEADDEEVEQPLDYEEIYGDFFIERMNVITELINSQQLDFFPKGRPAPVLHWDNVPLQQHIHLTVPVVRAEPQEVLVIPVKRHRNRNKKPISKK